MTEHQPIPTPDDPRREALAELAQEVTSMPVADLDDLVVYLGLSGRLATLGDEGPLRRWRDRCRFDVDLANVARERAIEGLDDLDSLDGEALALALVEAQDWYCAVRAEADLRRIHDERSAAGRALEAWFEEADAASLDDEAAGFVRAWLAKYPIPEGDRLGPMLAPDGMSEALLVLAATEPEPVQTVRAEREAPSAVNGDAVLKLAAAGTHASADECRVVARRAACTLSGRGDCRCDIWLEPDRTLRVAIEAADETVTAASIAGWPLERIEHDAANGTSVWSASVAGLDWKERSQVYRGPVRLRFLSGARVAIEG